MKTTKKLPKKQQSKLRAGEWVVSNCPIHPDGCPFQHTIFHP
jgi:hypothetical protein